jgi:molybdopterin converting factor small subunit
MEITVRLLASYRRYLPEDHDDQAGYRYRTSSAVRVGDVLASLPVPQSDAYTFLVNGRHAERDEVLAQGDVLSVFPAAGGG